jgi:Skp family chaperone for outer membrane proteins
VRNSFVILRMAATARYLHLKSQELHEALMDAHETIGFEVEEKVQMRGAVSASGADDQQVALLTDQLAATSTKHQEAEAAAAFNAERARLAEWDAGQLRGQIELVQQDLTRARNDLATVLPQAHKQVADLDDRLKASVAAEREASARSNQQATSLAELSARSQQQLDSSRANDERNTESLRQRQWTESQIYTLLSPTYPSSSSATQGGNASSSFTSRPALMSPGMGSTCLMYAASGNRGAFDTPAVN